MFKRLLPLVILAVAIASILGGCKSAEEAERERLQTEFDAARMCGQAPVWDDNDVIRGRMARLCNWLGNPIPANHMGITAFWYFGGGQRIEAARFAMVERDEKSGEVVVTASQELEGGATQIFRCFDLTDSIDLIALCCADMAQEEIERGLEYACEREAKDLMDDVESAAGHLRHSTSVEEGVRLADSWGINKLSPKAVEEYLKGDGLDKVFAPDPRPEDAASLQDSRAWITAKIASIKENLAEYRKQLPNPSEYSRKHYLAKMKEWRECVSSYELRIRELENELQSLSDPESAEREWREKAVRLAESKEIARQTLLEIAKSSVQK